MKRGPMQSKIPKDIRDELAEDPFMHDCLVAFHDCEGPIQWHHAFTYQGRRVNELYTILPLCEKHHKQMTKHIATICRMNIRQRIAEFKAYDRFKEKYPRSDLFIGV